MSIPSSINSLMLASGGSKASIINEGVVSRSVSFFSFWENSFFQRNPPAAQYTPWVFSVWLKKTHTLRRQDIAWSYNNVEVYFDATDSLIVCGVNTTAKFRDSDAWMHLYINPTGVWINGVKLSMPTASFNQSGPIVRLGSTVGGNSYSGLMAEVNIVAYANLPSMPPATSFGEISPDGQWVPRLFTGPHGVSGARLKFDKNATVAELGVDSSGNVNWVQQQGFYVSSLLITTNEADTASLTDVPSRWGVDNGKGGEVRGNYCTLSALKSTGNGWKINLGSANLRNLAFAGWPNQGTHGTLFAKSGKWYAEFRRYHTDSAGSFCYPNFGVIIGSSHGYYNADIYKTPLAYGFMYNGQKHNGTVFSGYASSWSMPYKGYIGVCLDLDARTLSFTADGVNLGVAFSNLPLGEYTFFGWQSGQGGYYVANFGQRPFAYPAPSGFKCLCTHNLRDPEVQRPSEAFKSIIYKGTGTSRAITSLMFKPSMVWLKRMTSAASDDHYYSHIHSSLLPSATGLPTYYSDSSSEVVGYGITSFDSNGFTLHADPLFSNENGYSYIARAFRGGSDWGLDTVLYTGTGTNHMENHSLGLAPQIVLTRNRQPGGGSVMSWAMYNKNVNGREAHVLRLNKPGYTAGPEHAYTNPTSTQFGVGGQMNLLGNNYISFLFSEKEGLSKFGAYNGSGFEDGPYIHCGFKPAFIMVKAELGPTTSVWRIYERELNPVNEAKLETYADLKNGPTMALRGIDFTSGGFKIRHYDWQYVNEAGSPYIFMAFAETPYKYSNAH